MPITINELSNVLARRRMEREQKEAQSRASSPNLLGGLLGAVGGALTGGGLPAVLGGLGGLFGGGGGGGNGPASKFNAGQAFQGGLQGLLGGLGTSEAAGGMGAVRGLAGGMAAGQNLQQKALFENAIASGDISQIIQAGLRDPKIAPEIIAQIAKSKYPTQSKPDILTLLLLQSNPELLKLYNQFGSGGAGGLGGESSNMGDWEVIE